MIFWVVEKTPDESGWGDPLWEIWRDWGQASRLQGRGYFFAF
jgi:hypothetical protein